MKGSKLILIIFILLIALPSVFSIGLVATNLKDEFFFQPNMEKSYSYNIKTNAGFTQDYELYVRMQTDRINLTRYVTLDKYYVEDVPSNTLVPFTATLKLPDKIDIPGYHEIRIGARETQAKGGGNFGIKTASEAILIIIVLYPYEYIEWSFSGQNTNVNDTAVFTISIQNLGEPKINEAKAKIRIYDSGENIEKTIFTDTKNILPSETETLTALLSTRDMKPGLYKAKAILNFNDNTSEKETEFLIGTLDVELVDYTKQFYENSTEKMEITVKSGWNSLIKSIYADIDVLDNENKKIEGKSFKTISELLNPWETKTLAGYFNTFGLVKDNYTIAISLNYGDISKTEIGKIEIIKAPEPEKEKPSFIEMISNTTTLLIVIAVLLIANITWMLIRARRRKRR